MKFNGGILKPHTTRKHPDKYVMIPALRMQTASRQVERAVEDLISAAEDRTLGISTLGASAGSREELRAHYNGLMYRAILSCIKSSLLIIKKRVCTKVRCYPGCDDTRTSSSKGDLKQDPFCPKFPVWLCVTYIIQYVHRSRITYHKSRSSGAD